MRWATISFSRMTQLHLVSVISNGRTAVHYGSERNRMCSIQGNISCQHCSGRTEENYETLDKISVLRAFNRNRDSKTRSRTINHNIGKFIKLSFVLNYVLESSVPKQVHFVCWDQRDWPHEFRNYFKYDDSEGGRKVTIPNYSNIISDFWPQFT
jgi:hypothetical protein